jgi:hypothetical protein
LPTTGAVTVTCISAEAVPPEPVHDRPNVVAAVSVELEAVPLVPFDQLQPPDAAHDVAFVEDQVIVVAVPVGTVAGFAPMVTVGAAGGGGGGGFDPVVTMTVAEAVALPPVPVHCRLKVALLVSTLLCWLPDVALLPVQAPEAVQEVAFVEDHVIVDRAPLATVVGFAEIVTVGAAGGGGGVEPPVTVTVAERAVLPPDPVQVRVYIDVAVKGPTVWLPVVALFPDHAPVPAHEVALLDVQLRTDVPPDAMEVGLA